jgi:hypothetical protein
VTAADENMRRIRDAFKGANPPPERVEQFTSIRDRFARD